MACWKGARINYLGGKVISLFRRQIDPHQVSSWWHAYIHDEPFSHTKEHWKNSIELREPFYGKETRRREVITLWNGMNWLSILNKGGSIWRTSANKTPLLQKWLWRFSSEERAIWRRFIAGTYGLLNHWTTEEVAGTFGCSVWKTIRRLWPHFNNNLSITIGNGLKIGFWNEV